MNHDREALRVLCTGTISTFCMPRLTFDRAARRIAPQPVGVNA